MNLILPKGRKENRVKEMFEFSNQLKEIQKTIDIKLSSRGWCYQLEGEPFRLINKDEFDKCESIINECRTNGYLPVDFVAEEDARQFSGVEIPDTETPLEYFADYLRTTLNCWNMYTPGWWNGEEYYIQMVVEKVDLKSLFSPICQQYHIPVATAKGWSSILQRAQYCRRFKEAEEQGLECVLLYCGDHDPDGLRISDFLRDNITELKEVTWIDGFDGYDPENLIIKRFGLDYDFIKENNLTWIDNLKTGSGGEIAKLVNEKIVQGTTKTGKPHPNFNMPYVQEYLKNYGVRKCEANSLVIRKEQAKQLCLDAIESYLGHDAIKRFQEKRQAIKDEVNGFLDERNLREPLQKMLDDLEDES